MRLKKTVLWRMERFLYFSWYARKILYCYRAHVAKTIVHRLKARREKRRRGLLILFQEFREHMLSHGVEKWREVVRATKATNVIRRWAKRELRRIRRKRVKIITRGAGGVMLGLARVVVVRRWASAVKVNMALKRHIAKRALVEITRKGKREGEILVAMKEVRKRR